MRFRALTTAGLAFEWLWLSKHTHIHTHTRKLEGTSSQWKKGCDNDASIKDTFTASKERHIYTRFTLSPLCYVAFWWTIKMPLLWLCASYKYFLSSPPPFHSKIVPAQTISLTLSLSPSRNHLSSALYNRLHENYDDLTKVKHAYRG